jgi:hypothetical protein
LVRTVNDILLSETFFQSLKSAPVVQRLPVVNTTQRRRPARELQVRLPRANSRSAPECPWVP